MSEKKNSILIVEDEADVLRINARMFTRRGYKVFTAQNCKEAFSLLETIIPDLLILDIMLPDGSGYDICRKVRLKSNNPVIFLTGKSEVSDKIEGLSQGGDYYLTKPYDLDELSAVAKRLIERHIQSKASESSQIIKKGELAIDISEKKVFINSKEVSLTSTEYALLLLLVNNEDSPVSASIIYEKIWAAPSGGDTRTVRFHITNLRRKLDADNAHGFDIVSVYGKGYMFTTIR